MIFRRITESPLGRGRAAGGKLPPEVQALLFQCIESYEQLEILLLLRARPSRAWSAHAIASELTIAAPMAEDACRSLCQNDLLSMLTGTGQQLFEYAAATPELDAAVRELARAYTDQPLEIIRAMTANAFARLRMKALGVFTDAFLRARSGSNRH